MFGNTFTLEEILLAQPLNPLKRVTFTAMPRFPLQPPAKPVATEQDEKTLTPENHKFRYLVVAAMTGSFLGEAMGYVPEGTLVKEVSAVYAKLDEVIA